MKWVLKSISGLQHSKAPDTFLGNNGQWVTHVDEGKRHTTEEKEQLMSQRYRMFQQFENDMVSIRAQIKKLEPIVEKNSTLFHSKAEVEGLYQSLSRFAGAYGLVISKIQKKKPVPILKPGIAQQAEELLQQNQISYYKIPVDYEIKGNFLNYIKFKRAVSRAKKMLNFDKELINVVQNDKNGSVIASGELTIVGLPNEFF